MQYEWDELSGSINHTSASGFARTFLSGENKTTTNFSTKALAVFTKSHEISKNEVGQRDRKHKLACLFGVSNANAQSTNCQAMIYTNNTTPHHTSALLRRYYNNWKDHGPTCDELICKFGRIRGVGRVAGGRTFSAIVVRRRESESSLARLHNITGISFVTYTKKNRTHHISQDLKCRIHFSTWTCGLLWMRMSHQCWDLILQLNAYPNPKWIDERRSSRHSHKIPHGEIFRLRIYPSLDYDEQSSWSQQVFAQTYFLIDNGMLN